MMIATNIQSETIFFLSLTSVGLRIYDPLNPAKVGATYCHSGAYTKCLYSLGAAYFLQLWLLLVKSCNFYLCNLTVDVCY